MERRWSHGKTSEEGSADPDGVALSFWVCVRPAGCAQVTLLLLLLLEPVIFGPRVSHLSGAEGGCCREGKLKALKPA